MRFRNAVHIAIDNFSSVFKMLLYRLVVAAVTFSLVYVILRLSLDGIIHSGEAETLRSMLGDFFRALFSGDSAALQSFQENFHGALSDFFALLAQNGGAIAGAAVGVCIMYLFSRFLNGLCLFALAGIMHDRMSLFSRTGFSASYFKHLGNAALYEVIYVPLAFVYDALTILVCWFIFFYVPSFLPSWGWFSVLLSLCLTITLVVFLEALKMTLISAWLPSIVSGDKSVRQGLHASLRCKHGFWRRMASYVAAVYVVIAMNVMFGLFTIGSALLLTVPLSFLFLLALQFVYYFEDGEKKYFISVHDIAGAPAPQCTDDLLTAEDSLEPLNRKLNDAVPTPSEAHSPAPEAPAADGQSASAPAASEPAETENSENTDAPARPNK